MNPALLLLLIGGGALALSKKKGPLKWRSIKVSCSKRNGATWAAIGPLNFRLPSNVSIRVVDRRPSEISPEVVSKRETRDDPYPSWDPRSEAFEQTMREDAGMAPPSRLSPSVTECGSFRDVPWLIEISWDDGEDLTATRDLINLIIRGFGDSQPTPERFPEIHFLLSIELRSKPSAELGIFASFKGWEPSKTDARRGAISPTHEEFFEEYLKYSSDVDVFTHAQYAVGVVHQVSELYDPSGNGVIWHESGDRVFESGTRYKLRPSINCKYSKPLLGRNFLPTVGSVNAEEAPSLKQALSIPGNTAWGYVDWLLHNDLMLQPALKLNDVSSASQYIAKKILRQSGIPCNVDSLDWVTAEGPKVFYDWMVDSIKPWVSDHLGGVPFN